MTQAVRGRRLTAARDRHSGRSECGGGCAHTRADGYTPWCLAPIRCAQAGEQAVCGSVRGRDRPRCGHLVEVRDFDGAPSVGDTLGVELFAGAMLGRRTGYARGQGVSGRDEAPWVPWRQKVAPGPSFPAARFDRAVASPSRVVKRDKKMAGGWADQRDHAQPSPVTASTPSATCCWSADRVRGRAAVRCW